MEGGESDEQEVGIGAGQSGKETVRWEQDNGRSSGYRGELGWWPLEERREEKKLFYGRRLSDMDEDRLVKNVMGCIERRNDAIGWWREYQSLLEKYEIDGE